MDREDIQSRRAANQVWNGAENYDVRPEFQSYDSDGEAQLYFNTIIGLVYRYYQFDRFKPLFHTFQHQPKGELYSGLFWLGLEGAAYRRALPDRPVLQELRQDYARRVVKEAHAADPQSAESLHAAWFRRALGQPEQEDAWQKDVLDALTFDPTWDEQQIMDRMEALLSAPASSTLESVAELYLRQYGRANGKTVFVSAGGCPALERVCDPAELVGLFCAAELPQDFPGRGYCFSPDAEAALYELDLY